MSRRAIILLCALSAVISLTVDGQALSQAVAAGEKIDLRLRYVTGSYELTQEVTMAQTIAVAGQQMVQNIQMTIVMATDVGKLDPKGRRKLQLQFKRIKQNMQMGPIQMAFDSAGPPEQSTPAMAQILQPMLEARVTATLDANSKVIEVKGLDEVWQKTAAANPAMVPIINQMKGQMGDEFLKQTLMNSAKHFPGKTVGIGDTWTVENSLPMPMLGKAKVKQNSKLTAIEQTPAGAVAIVRTIGEINIEKGSTMKTGGATITFTKVDVDQKIRGRLHAANAMLSEVTIKQTGFFAATIATPDGQGQSMTIQQEATIKTTARQTTPAATRPAGT